MRRALVAVLGMGLLAAGLLVAWPWLDRAPDWRGEPPPAPAADAVQRGAYLARVGHCAGCHTPRGGADYAGGRVIATPFGGVVAANLTPDPQAGIGRWTAGAFRRALREARSADGRRLLPACPTDNLALVTDADADDLFAYLRSLPPQPQAVPPHSLRWPYGSPQALALWHGLQGRPSLPAAPAGAPADWARGAYLVGGPGHCSGCHGRRDRWGATEGPWDFRGGVIPLQGWHAPSLTDAAEGGVQDWAPEAVVALLRDGRHGAASLSGPMAVVTAHSLQHWTAPDLSAAATFLRSLPRTPSAGVPASPPEAAVLARGDALYRDHCADCHGHEGEGVADDGPPLAGNRAVAMRSPVNVMRSVLGGGFGPSTAAHPRPAGMPPFATVLSDADIAAVVSTVRWRFGAGATGVSAFEVNSQRGGDLN